MTLEIVGLKILMKGRKPTSLLLKMAGAVMLLVYSGLNKFLTITLRKNLAIDINFCLLMAIPAMLI